MFTKLPHRNCKMADIPDYLCSCDSRYIVNSDSDVIRQAGYFLARYINENYLKDYLKLCSHLKLNKIIRVQKFKINIQTIYNI